MSVDIALVVVGFTVLVVGSLSSSLKRVGLSVPLVALALGALLGPEVLHVLEPQRLGDERHVLDEIARLGLALSLTATGLQFRREDLRVNARRGALLLTAVMVGMWLATSLGAGLVLGIPAGLALVVGAILAPTDPVVSSTIVTGRLAEANLPRWLRRTLQLESGANDGLALPLVLVPALVLAEPGRSVAGAVLEALSQVLKRSRPAWPSASRSPGLSTRRRRARSWGRASSSR